MLEVTENYRKALELVKKGLATKNEMDGVDLKLEGGFFGWVYPDEIKVQIYYIDDNDEEVYCDCGDIDSQLMKVIGYRNNYDIR